MTETGGDDISRITDKDVHHANVRAFNATRQLIVGGVLTLLP
jgi:hypothetical protein